MAILHTFAVTGPGSARPATVGGGACCAARKGATFLASPGESGNIPGVRHGPDRKIQVPQNPLGQDPASDRGEVKPFWSRSKPEARKRRWRDATLMDLAAPEMRRA